jgi:hypothetical protein
MWSSHLAGLAAGGGYAYADLPAADSVAAARPLLSRHPPALARHNHVQSHTNLIVDRAYLRTHVARRRRRRGPPEHYVNVSETQKIKHFNYGEDRVASDCIHGQLLLKVIFIVSTNN